MTKDMIPDDDDTRLEAFLRKEDDLSKLMQSIEQAQPSDELDAAILAHVETELANEKSVQKAAKMAIKTIKQLAANDPVIPGIRSASRLPFVSRWKIPLSLAATLVLTLSVVWMQQRGGEQDANAPVVVATAPEAASAPVSSVPAAAPPPVAAAPVALAEKKRADAVALARRETAAREAAAEAKAKSSDTKLASEKQAAMQLAMRQEAKPAEPAKAAPTVLAKAETTDAATNTARGSLAGASVAAEPAAAPMAVPASVQPAAMAPRPAPAPVAANDSASHPLLGPRDWMRKIDGKIMTGAHQEALDEWVKFRRAYPEFVVPQSMQEKIDAIKKP